MKRRSKRRETRERKGKGRVTEGKEGTGSREGKAGDCRGVWSPRTAEKLCPKSVCVCFLEVVATKSTIETHFLFT